MNFYSSFLFVTAITYLFAFFWPHQITLNLGRIDEKLGMLLSGTLILVNLFLNNTVLWIIMATWWSISAGLSYIGVILWKAHRKSGKPSQPHQVFMTGWDLLIAVSCISYVPLTFFLNLL